MKTWTYGLAFFITFFLHQSQASEWSSASVNQVYFSQDESIVSFLAGLSMIAPDLNSVSCKSSSVMSNRANTLAIEAANNYLEKRVQTSSRRQAKVLQSPARHLNLYMATPIEIVSALGIDLESLKNKSPDAAFELAQSLVGDLQQRVSCQFSAAQDLETIFDQVFTTAVSAQGFDSLRESQLRTVTYLGEDEVFINARVETGDVTVFIPAELLSGAESFKVEILEKNETFKYDGEHSTGRFVTFGSFDPLLLIQGLEVKLTVNKQKSAQSIRLSKEWDDATLAQLKRAYLKSLLTGDGFVPRGLSRSSRAQQVAASLQE